jgi:hypothetical protein
MMNLDNFLSTINITHLGIVADPYNAWQTMIYNKYDNVSFDIKIDFKINNIAIMEMNKDGNYIFSYAIQHQLVDLITNISSDVHTNIEINGILYPSNLNLLCCDNPYAQKNIKFIISPYHTSDTFSLKLKCYIFNQKVKDFLNITNLRNNMNIHLANFV